MSKIKCTTLANASDSKSVPVDTIVQGSAKAWVSFNGVGVPSIRAAFNVASITDVNTGIYTLNFTNAMPDANYSVGGFVQIGTATTYIKTIAQISGDTMTATALMVRTSSGGTSTVDADIGCVQVYR